MKKINLLSSAWLIVIGLLLSMNSYSQESYSCNLICANQTSHIMAGAQVDLYDSNNNFFGTTFTNDQGIFTFDNLIVGENYTAKFTYDAENTYVDLADVFILLRYLVGLTDLDEYRLISANVNGDDRIDYHDFMTMLIDYYILQIPFPVGDWYLPDWNFTMTADKATGGPTYASATGQLEDEDPNKEFYHTQLNYTPIVDVEQTEMVIPVYFNETIETSGVGLVLAYNNDLIEVTRIESVIEGMNYNVNNGEIRIGWADCNNLYKFNADEALINVHIKQKSSNSMDQIERLTLVEGTHILNKSGEKYPYVEFSSPEFNLKSNNIDYVHQEIIYPNPCTTHFNLNIDNPNEENLELLIYNSLGQLVHSESINHSETQKQVNIQNLDNGVYFYQINYQSKSLTGSVTVRK